jgi:hypothetical protein
MSDESPISRRRFAALGAAGAIGLGLEDAPAQTPAADARPESLKSQFLMDLILETAPAVSMGNRTIVAVTGGTFEGPKLKGKVVGPGADWPVRVNDRLRILDVRILLVTDDDHKIYMTYRGVIHTPAGQGERYWRTVPIFETDSTKYEWLNSVVAVGVNFAIPQRVSYRIFQIL